MLKKTDNTYKNWIIELKSRIQKTQAKAAIQVNSALIELCWNLGKEIAESGFENTYGSGFFKQLSADLKKEFPDAKGYSVTNLKYFNRFYLFYKQEVENRQQAADEYPTKFYLIPWWHHVVIMTKCESIKEALFYIDKTIENGWSRAILQNMISTNLYETQGKAVSNFAKTLPPSQSELVQQTLKDPYVFDFLTLTETYKEIELENAA